MAKITFNLDDFEFFLMLLCDIKWLEQLNFLLIISYELNKKKGIIEKKITSIEKNGKARTIGVIPYHDLKFTIKDDETKKLADPEDYKTLDKIMTKKISPYRSCKDCIHYSSFQLPKTFKTLHCRKGHGIKFINGCEHCGIPVPIDECNDFELNSNLI